MIRQGLCSQPAHLWATCDFVSFFEALGTPANSRGDVPNPPNCGPLWFSSPAVNQWGWQRLCGHSIRLRTIIDFVHRSEALGTFPDGRGDVANPHTCKPVLILSPTLKHWDPPDGRVAVANPPTCGPVLSLPQF